MSPAILDDLIMKLDWSRESLDNAIANVEKTLSQARGRREYAQLRRILKSLQQARKSVENVSKWSARREEQCREDSNSPKS